MRYAFRYLRRAFLYATFCFGMGSICLGRGIAGWKLDAPPNSVKLVSVTPLSTPGPLKLTFRNVSGKTIVWLDVDNLHNGHSGESSFYTGEQFAFASGGAIWAAFDSRNFAAGAREVRVDAIFYGDGSGYGYGPWKARIESKMLGAALETARDVQLLLASPNPGIAGLDSVLAQINSQPVGTPTQAARTLRRVTLPGVPQAFIQEHLAQHGAFVSAGARTARSGIQVDISNAKSNDAKAMSAGSGARLREAKLRPRALADLAARLSAVSRWQARYIQMLLQGRQ